MEPTGQHTGHDPEQPPRRPRKRLRRPWLLVALAVLLMFSGAGAVAGALYFESVPTPEQLELPESTTVYYADGTTPMAKLGTENRTILRFGEMNDAVKQSVVAAEDQTFWTNQGVDFGSILRAAKNNVTGGRTQGASTITQQYARIAADLKGVTYSRKLREAVMAWKLDDRYSKEQILEFYLNTVPFGRGAYGIEAAAQTFFGKTANRSAPQAEQVTVAEAMVLVSMIKQPEADPGDPEGSPGYDPSRSPKALENSKTRWAYVRENMVALRYLQRAQADALTYPDTVKKPDPAARQTGLDRSTGLVVGQAVAELRRTEQFRGKPADYLRNGGFRIVTTIDKRAQDAAEAAADLKRQTAPQVVRGQPQNWQAALVAVEPGTGRVLAYYGGSNGTGADYAGWYLDEAGKPRGFGAHPPGSSFKVYDLAEALHQNISMKSRWDSPPSKEFPASGRVNGSPAGPIRNAGSARCQPDCALWEATVASLNVTFFELTEKLGTDNVIDMASKAGIDAMWANRPGEAEAARVELRGKPGRDVAGQFSTEVGIGQYPVTVLDQANGMATFAAAGKRADAHFVRSVSKGGDEIYREHLEQRDVGLNQEQINQLNWTLRQVEAAKLPNGWDSAGKTGTWQRGDSLTENAHTWMVGYTGAVAAAVWLGTTDGKALVTKDGDHDVFGASYPGAIWRQFMVDAAAALQLDRNKYRFAQPAFPPERSAPPPSRAAPPSTPASARPGTTPPSCRPPNCASPRPSRTRPASPPASAGPPSVRPSATAGQD
ncbi:penicillin-binding protein [Dactylosporangium roseum]|uniref:Penicillin-binding protein n=1 Tax=Dactylosporangium roseum TaxID=47989 RepID=A0ABY5YWC0_9ACTN|nr:transglycosylase domain-containing protein [Dactylosporangium roseum]UWZ34043.1 penicillin-binding protein [Dactylosporangium roseum]